MRQDNQSYNILMLSAGRRVELVKCFKNAARRLNIKSKIIGGDCSASAPALYFTDKTYILPRISEPEYIDSIISICRKEDIALIVPTVDTDLLILSEQKSYIETNTRAKVLVSDETVIRICGNKTDTQRFFEENSFLVPHLYTNEQVINNEINYPVFIKPKDGSSSINAFRVDNADELKLFYHRIPNPLVQELIQGEEYSIDVFLDFSGEAVTIVPRSRLSVRGGEISKGKIVKDQNIIADIRRMMKLLKPIGHITIQGIQPKDESGIRYIEINPRFGGGAPMSIQCGADSCENLYRLLCGEHLDYYEGYRDNLIFLRFDESICLDENMKQVHIE